MNIVMKYSHWIQNIWIYSCHAEHAKHPVKDVLLDIHYCSLQRISILDSSPSAQNDCVRSDAAVYDIEKFLLRLIFGLDSKYLDL